MDIGATSNAPSYEDVFLVGTEQRFDRYPVHACKRTMLDYGLMFERQHQFTSMSVPCFRCFIGNQIWSL
jgi:hypothetical protein